MLLASYTSWHCRDCVCLFVRGGEENSRGKNADGIDRREGGRTAAAATVAGDTRKRRVRQIRASAVVVVMFKSMYIYHYSIVVGGNTRKWRAL